MGNRQLGPMNLVESNYCSLYALSRFSNRYDINFSNLTALLSSLFGVDGQEKE